MRSRPTVTLITDPGLGKPALWGVGELSRALRSAGYEVRASVQFPEEPPGRAVVVAPAGSPLLARVEAADGLRPPPGREAFALARGSVGGNAAVCVVGSDDDGVKFGCLELAEQEDVFGAFRARTGRPDLRVRRLQVFLHNADLERPWYHDEAFWDRYLDFLARSRYNEFNLTFGHQTSYLIPVYPYLFEVDGYPQVRVEGLSEGERERNLGMLRFISRLARERGLTFFAGIWQSRPWKQQESPVRGLPDEALQDFTRRGIVKLLKLCPDVGGLQLRMNPESGLADQGFFRDVFVPAIGESGREIEVEIRNWGLKPETLEAFVEQFPRLRVSFKYFAEHQAMPYQPARMRRSYSYDSLLRKDRRYDVAWHLWNLGTHRLFLWGDPDHVRAFVGSCHLGDGVGFEVTPPLSQKGFSQHGQVPGYWSVRPGDCEPRSGRWEWERYWFFYALWGRIGYDPQTDDAVWLRELGRRFGAGAAPHLLEAYRAGSRVIGYLVSHHMDDRNMYNWLELDNGGPIDYFSGITPGERTLFWNARDYAGARMRNALSARVTPFQAADDLEGFAGRCQAALARAEAAGDQRATARAFSDSSSPRPNPLPAGEGIPPPPGRGQGGGKSPANPVSPLLPDNDEYALTRVDMDALSLLARYNAAKIRASACLCLFYESGDLSLLREAGRRAREALALWRELVGATGQHFYGRLQLGPTGGHWRDNLRLAEYDVRRIERVEEIFRRYGNFRMGFDFGPRVTLRGRGHDRPEADYDLLEPRFARVAEGDRYSTEAGYGWEHSGGISGATPGPLPLHVLRGARSPWVDDAAPEVPDDFLCADSLSSAEPAIFRADVPNGSYRVTVAAADALVEVNGRPAEEESAVVEVADGLIRVELAPAAGGQWVLTALTVSDWGPRIGHVPVHVAPRGTDMTVSATVTAPAGAAGASLFYGSGDGRWRQVPMAADGPVHTATIPAARLEGNAVEYWIRAEDGEGNASCFPPGGADGPARALLAAESGPPRIAEHRPVAGHSASEPMHLAVKLADDRDGLDVRLHYRTVDQNADFRTLAMRRTGVGEYAATIPAGDLDPLFDEMYYFEAVDAAGRGSFHPDPFAGTRYHVVSITP